jgi:hypothetical protein
MNSSFFRATLLALLLVFGLNHASADGGGQFNVRDFGATGDGHHTVRDSPRLVAK